MREPRFRRRMRLLRRGGPDGLTMWQPTPGFSGPEQNVTMPLQHWKDKSHR